MTKTNLLSLLLIASLQLSALAITNKEAISYCEKHDDAYLVTLWPNIAGVKKVKGKDSVEYVESELSKIAKIIYCRKLDLKKNGPYLFIKNVYSREQAKHNKAANFTLAREKERKSFSKWSLVRSYLVQSNDIDALIECKRRLRSKLEFNIMHIPDTHEEAVELAYFVYADGIEKMLNEGDID